MSEIIGMSIPTRIFFTREYVSGRDFLCCGNPMLRFNMGIIIGQKYETARGKIIPVRTIAYNSE